MIHAQYHKVGGGGLAKLSSYREQAAHVAQRLQTHDAVADACKRIVVLFADMG
jgi:hypothetical protein